MTFWYCCYTCQLIGSYQDKAGQADNLSDDIIHHPHPMVFSIRSYEKAKQYLDSCLKDKYANET